MRLAGMDEALSSSEYKWTDPWGYLKKKNNTNNNCNNNWTLWLVRKMKIRTGSLHRKRTSIISTTLCQSLLLQKHFTGSFLPVSTPHCLHLYISSLRPQSLHHPVRLHGMQILYGPSSLKPKQPPLCNADLQKDVIKALPCRLLLSYEPAYTLTPMGS
jgi:hypothetical protein